MSTQQIRFTLSQLTELQTRCNAIETVDPCGDAYRRLVAFLDTLDQEHLRFLASARIKFLSALARNRVRPAS